MLTLVLVVLIVLSVSMIASCTEAAVFSITYSKVRAMANAKKPGAKALLRLKDRMAQSISTIVIIDNMADIVGSALVGTVASRIFNSASLGLFFGAFTFTAILGAKIIPKTLGEAHAEKIAPLVAPGVILMTRVFKPLHWIIGKVLSLFGHGHSIASISEEEIKVMAQIGHESGSIEKDESHLIHRVFKLNDITSEDMMTPLSNVESISGDQSLGEQRDSVLRLRHSRIPVWSETPENVLGIALLDDLLLAVARDHFEAKPTEFLQEALTIASDVPADDLLEIFRKREQHLAIVMDADKKMIGVVTLEDVLEELVGEITDEKDVRPETIKRLSKTEILVDEATEISHINRFFNVKIAAHGTIGDFVVEKIGHRPKPGEEVADGEVVLRVEKVTRTRPKLIKISKTA
jgi:CBS domain containing-hemolysin-like protein